MRFQILLLTFTALFFGGCIFSKSNESEKSHQSNTTSETSFPLNEKRIKDIIKIDEGAGYFVTAGNKTGCNDSILWQQIYTDTTFYEISNGELYLWDYRDACYSRKYMGNSSSIKGKWSRNNAEEILVKKQSSDAELSECQYIYLENGYPDEEYQLNQVAHFGDKLKISDNTIDQNTSWDICLASDNYYLLENLSLLDTNSKIIEKSCSEFNIKNGTKEANVQFTNIGINDRSESDDYVMTFTYDGKSCEKIIKSLQQPKPKSDADCVEEIKNEKQWFVNYDVFEECIEKTGFHAAKNSEP